METDSVYQKGKAGVGGNKRTAEYVGGGTALGAVIGAIAGHGKGAAIGAASGAAAGAGAQIFTRGSVKSAGRNHSYVQTAGSHSVDER